MPRNKKSKAGPPRYYVITKQLPGDANLFGIPGDSGALIDALKLYNITPHRLDQLKRLYIAEFKGDRTYECKCGVKFDSDFSHQAHARRRHIERRTNIKDLSDCSDAEKARILDDIDRYETTPLDFHVPDPDDRQMLAADRQLEANMDWSKTAANQR